MELIMARETILSPSHYRLTAFLFSYYSPVKTSGGGVRARGGGGGYTPHSSLLKNFILKKKKTWQSEHTPEWRCNRSTWNNAEICALLQSCDHAAPQPICSFFFSTLFMMSQTRAKLGIHVVQRFLGVKRLMQVAVTHACTPKAKAHRC